MHLDEDLGRAVGAQAHGPGDTGGEGRLRRRGCSLVERGVAQRPFAAPIVEQEELGTATRGVHAREDGRGPAGGHVGPDLLVESQRPVGHRTLAEGDGLDEDLDGPAAREPDLPRILVAEIEGKELRP